MKVFDLPPATEFGKVVPKNAFDKYTNSKQKKMMSDSIQRIRWINKLSPKTTNLPSKHIEEIQVFFVELKYKNDIPTILNIIQRVIPYHIVFILQYEEEIKISTAAKHLNPSLKDTAVLDFTLESSWYYQNENTLQINLTRSIDWVFVDFCCQLLGREKVYQNYTTFLEKEKEVQDIQKKIAVLQKKIKQEKQFKKKVVLNSELNEFKLLLRSLV